MFKRLLTVALLATTAVPALAGGGVLTDNRILTCALKQKDGKLLTYRFVSVDEGILAEIEFIKDGTSTTSDVGKRPPWTFSIGENGINTLRSMRTPEFAIITRNAMEENDAALRADAILTKGERVIATGGCGFMKVRRSAPAAPKARPELGV